MFGMGPMSRDINTFNQQYDNDLINAFQRQTPLIAQPNPWQLPQNINVTLTQAKPPGLLESALQNPAVLQLLLGIISNIASFGGRKMPAETSNSGRDIWQSSGDPYDWNNIKRGYDAKEFLERMIRHLPTILLSTSIGGALGGTLNAKSYAKYIDFSDDDERKRFAKAITFGILAGAGIGALGGAAVSAGSNLI